MIDMTSPATSKRPFEVSTGIFENGRKKTGKSTTTENNAQKEILSKIFDNI